LRNADDRGETAPKKIAQANWPGFDISKVLLLTGAGLLLVWLIGSAVFMTWGGG
jgi:hypothetical protein